MYEYKVINAVTLKGLEKELNKQAAVQSIPYSKGSAA